MTPCVYVCMRAFVHVCLSFFVCVFLLKIQRFSPDGTRVAVGSDDACVDIYSVSNLVRTSYCRGIPSQVTHLDWSHDAAYLQVS